MQLLVLHGPNLGSLGRREPALYGTMPLLELNRELHREAIALHAGLVIHQSNHEGDLLDWLEEYRDLVDGCLFNPGAYTHTSIALLDGVLAFGKPVVEIHLTEPLEREPFRHESYVGRGCVKRFAGQGLGSYLEGMRWLLAFLEKSRS